MARVMAYGGWLDTDAPDFSAATLHDVETSLRRVRRWPALDLGTAWDLADHSLLVRALLERDDAAAETQMIGLFHDTAEPLLGGDMPAPVKSEGGAWYRHTETRLWRAILTRFVPEAARDSVDWWVQQSSAELRRADAAAAEIELRAMRPDLADEVFGHGGLAARDRDLFDRILWRGGRWSAAVLSCGGVE